MTDRATVVTGMGCLCAAGPDLDTAWKSMMAGVSRPHPPSSIRVETKRPSPVFEIAAGERRPSSISLGRPVAKTLSVEYLLSALEEAAQQAGLELEAWRGRRVGVCLGTTVGCTLNDERFYRDFRAGMEPGLKAIHRFLDNNPAQFVNEALDLRGPVCTINNACSSGTDAVGQAREWIQDGLCEVVIAGGTDELSRIPYLGFSSLLNTSEKPCRPFDARRDGLNLGEGAGVLIVESQDHAARRGAKALVEVAGYGCSADAHHITAPHPGGAGLERAVRQALADRDPGRVSFINAHGTATVPNDMVEGQTLARIFGSKVPVVGTKSYTGHALGAAGALEAVFTVQGLLLAEIPATIGFEQPDPECAVVPTTGPTRVAGTYAISTSLAFGGTNSAILMSVVK